MIKKRSFRECIEAVRDAAFKAQDSPSDCPVILHLEDHCCPAQQVQLALIMEEVLGDTLFRPAEERDISAVEMRTPPARRRYLRSSSSSSRS